MQFVKKVDALLQLFSTNCILDSFTFVENLRNFQFPTSSQFLCSFDISNLFTSIPLQETIEICANTLYDDNLVPPPFPREIFIEPMQTATSSVKFSFNDTIYRQTDGVAMGPPLGPVLANIVFG